MVSSTPSVSWSIARDRHADAQRSGSTRAREVFANTRADVEHRRAGGEVTGRDQQWTIEAGTRQRLRCVSRASPRWPFQHPLTHAVQSDADADRSTSAAGVKMSVPRPRMDTFCYELQTALDVVLVRPRPSHAPRRHPFTMISAVADEPPSPPTTSHSSRGHRPHGLLGGRDPLRLTACEPTPTPTPCRRAVEVLTCDRGRLLRRRVPASLSRRRVDDLWHPALCTRPQHRHQPLLSAERPSTTSSPCADPQRYGLVHHVSSGQPAGYAPQPSTPREALGRVLPPAAGSSAVVRYNAKLWTVPRTCKRLITNGMPAGVPHHQPSTCRCAKVGMSTSPVHEFDITGPAPGYLQYMCVNTSLCQSVAALKPGTPHVAPAVT